MNLDPEAVACGHGNSKTIPKRRFRRRVGVCCPVPCAGREACRWWWCSTRPPSWGLRRRQGSGEGGQRGGEVLGRGGHVLTMGDINRMVSEISGVPLPRMKLPDTVG